MKPGTPPTPPDAEANDPLLTALRQRLENYGQAPPPGTWVAIRQQLPPPPQQRRPLAWWQVASLLGLLLGLLVAGGLAVRPASRWAAAWPGTASLTEQPTGRAIDTGPSAVKPTLQPTRQLTAHTPAPLPSLASSAPATWPSHTAVPHSAVAKTKRSRAGHPNYDSGRYQTNFSVTPAAAAETVYASTRAAGQLARRRSYQANRPASGHRTRLSARRVSLRQSQLLAKGEQNAELPEATAPNAAGVSSAVNQYPAAVFGSPVEAMLPKLPSLTSYSAPLPHLLVVQPNGPTNRPAPTPAGQWELQLLVGPTISYRQLGTPSARPSFYVNFVAKERPALGLGVQAQVRRTLTNRWALAVGLGYHEYATRLSLDLDTGRAPVHFSDRRDIYRLLTLPVQATYTLSNPHKRLTAALLAGIEPGYFLSSLSTENAFFPYEQQRYPLTSSASQSPWGPVTNPYHTWSLALSLGLDLRYRLGKPESRWHLVVQPTGRYVVTPFVQNGVYFTQRYPFSLGLFAGFSRYL